MSLIPEFGGVLATLLAFVVALSVIVAIHEYGHYIVGRWSGIKADVFSLGFGPVLFSRMDKRGTRWQFALLPFGGYVKFAGDADAASSGRDDAAMQGLSEAERRATMHGAPLWARAATVAAGPVFNFIFSILIFTAVMMSEGVPREPLTVGSMPALPVEHELEPGDVLLDIAGEPVPDRASGATWQTLLDSVPKENLLDYRVQRDGSEMEVDGPYPFPPLIGQLAPQSAAYDIGLEPGDVILSVDGTPIVAFDDLRVAVEGSDGRALPLEVWRDGEVLDFVLAPRRVDEPQPDGGFETQWRIGIIGGLFFEPATEAQGIGQSLWGGIAMTGEIVRGSISGLYHMVTGAISSCNLSGPIGIAQTSGAMASQGTASFIWFIAVLSTAVGLLNLFPIPVLDGGHLVFYGYEAVAGRAPSDGALRVMMTAGLAVVLGLMIFALTNDIFCP